MDYIFNLMSRRDLVRSPGVIATHKLPECGVIVFWKQQEAV